MGFSPMDGFFLAVFMAVCIAVAVIIRCICYRCCMQSCSDKFRRSNEDDILPRHTTPTITPTGHHQRQHQQQHTSQNISNSGGTILPSAGTVFSIYTFPQQSSPELSRSERTIGLSKYSNLHCDPPPKYEDLFPLDSKDSTNISNTFELQVTQQQSLQETRNSSAPEPSVIHTSASSSSFCTPSQIIPAVPSSISLPATNTRQPSAQVPKEAPPLYDAIFQDRSGE